MIKEAIVKIVSKQDLTYDEAYAVMNEIMSGETTPTQNAAFLAALSTKSAKAHSFNISTLEQAAKMAGIADGAIVGSAIIKLLEQYGKDAPEHIGAYVKSMKDAVREYTI